MYCLAMMLHGVGIEMLVDQTTAQCFHERRIHMVLSDAPGVPGKISQDIRNRRGMRVPLNSMEEGVGLIVARRQKFNE